MFKAIVQACNSGRAGDAMSKKGNGFGNTYYDSLTEETARRATHDVLMWQRQGYDLAAIERGLVAHHGRFRDEDVASIVEEASQRYRALPDDQRHLARPLTPEQKAAKAEAERRRIAERPGLMEECRDRLEDFVRGIGSKFEDAEATAVASIGFEYYPALTPEEVMAIANGVIDRELDRRDQIRAEKVEEAKLLARKRWAADAAYSGSALRQELKLKFGLDDSDMRLVILGAQNELAALGKAVDEAELAAALGKPDEPVRRAPVDVFSVAHLMQ